MNKLLYILYSFSLLALTSCEKQEQAYVLPLRDTTTTAHPILKGVTNIGPNYDDAVFFSLTYGSTVTRPFNSYDLAFEASPNGFHIYLNTGKFMFACRTGSTNITTADTTGKEWFVDNDHLDNDSLAINNTYHSSTTPSQVFVIDRGKPHYLFNWTERLRKIIIQEVTANSYTIIYSKYNNTSLDTFTITKDAAYSLMYFSFDNGGKMVQMAPEKNQWDFVFTRYTHTYYDEPIGSPYRYYLVNGGGLNNRWNGVTGTIIKDSLPYYIPFSAFTFTDCANHTFGENADVIGFSWKEYDFNSSSYLIVPNKYFVIKDVSGVYYKILFKDFYNSQTGEKGYITFDYQQISN